jgi:orotate phosphoribosyltransferase
MLLSRYYLARKADAGDSPVADVIVGIAISGIPLATVIAVQEAAQLAIYHPAKQNTSEKPTGSISGNFAPVSGQRCLIVDDTITSGNTLRELVKYLKKHNATPVAICVIFDKRGIRDVEGVPVYPLFRISRID